MEQQKVQERVGFYSLLRALYTYPLTEPVLEVLAGLDLPLAPGLTQMQARLQGNGSMSETLEALNTEMTRLLEGPGLTPAPPYASYYLHNGQLMGPAAVAVRQIYLEWQVVPEGEARLPDDHVALELGFLAYLAARAAEGGEVTERALQASREFIRQHLMPWLPRFCAALGDASTDPFFTGLARFTQAIIEADLAWLDQMIAETTETVDAI